MSRLCRPRKQQLPSCHRLVEPLARPRQINTAATSYSSCSATAPLSNRSRSRRVTEHRGTPPEGSPLNRSCSSSHVARSVRRRVFEAKCASCRTERVPVVKPTEVRQRRATVVPAGRRHARAQLAGLRHLDRRVDRGEVADTAVTGSWLGEALGEMRSMEWEERPASVMWATEGRRLHWGMTLYNPGYSRCAAAIVALHCSKPRYPSRPATASPFFRAAWSANSAIPRATAAPSTSLPSA